MALETDRRGVFLENILAYENFFRGFFYAMNKVGTDVFEKISRDLELEIEKRIIKGESGKNVEETKEIFKNKLSRWRPRFLGSLGAYFLLSNISITEIEKNKGLEAFRLLWFMGSAQDDLIDGIARHDLNLNNPALNPKRSVLNEIFGKDAVFYRASYTVLVKYVDRLDIGKELKVEIYKRIAAWYKFLVQQETEVVNRDFSEYNFNYCVNYRETQNEYIGSLLICLLNGEKFKDSNFSKLESIMPKLSFRTQIIDDIADIAEDIEQERPSYAVGALNEFPNELSAVKAYIQSKNGVKTKFDLNLFKMYAPESYRKVKGKFDEYGKDLMELGLKGKLLKRLGDVTYYMFPIIRNIVYKVNPKYANF